MIYKFKASFVFPYIVGISIFLLIITSCSNGKVTMDNKKTEIQPYTFSFDKFSDTDINIFNTIIRETALAGHDLPVYIKEVPKNEITMLLYLYSNEYNNAQVSLESDKLTITLGYSTNMNNTPLFLKVTYDSGKISTIRLKEKD